MRRDLTSVAVGVIVALALLAVPASADHGYQTFRFTNKLDKRVFGIVVEFDRELSHIGDKEPTWPGALCDLVDSGKTVVCKSKEPLHSKDSFKLSVATPPKDDGSYERARIDRWSWRNSNGSITARWRDACARRSGCVDLGVQK